MTGVLYQGVQHRLMFTLFTNWYRRHFSQPGTVEFALVLIAGFVVLYYFMWLVGPLVVALCLAYVLDWGVEWLIERFNMSRPAAAAVVMLAFIGVAILALVLLVPQIIKQGVQFYQSMEQFSQDAAGVPHGAAFTMTGQDLDSHIAAKVYELIKELPDPLYTMVDQETLRNTIRSLRQQLLASTITLMRTQLVPSVFNVFTYLMYLIIVPIFTFLMLRNKSQLQNRFLRYILPANQVVIKEFWPAISAQIQGYIRGKILHIIIITCVNTLAFRLFSLNYAVLLGFGVALSVVIPYVGAVIIAVPVVLVAVFQFGFTYSLLWLLLVYLIIQLLDSNVLTPMLFSKAMNLDAFSILAAILIFGGLWGFWGVFFAIPLATFVKTIIVGWPSADVRKNLTAALPSAKLSGQNEPSGKQQ